MTHCITSRRGTSKLLELVPNPFDDINKICSKQTLEVAYLRRTSKRIEGVFPSFLLSLSVLFPPWGGGGQCPFRPLWIRQ